MADEAEQSEEKAALLLAATVEQMRHRAAQDNVPTIEGDCEVCGVDSKRLVQSQHPKDGPCWACARCRDKFKLPRVKVNG